MLAARGATVTLAARRTRALESVRARIEAAGHGAATLALDVTDGAAVAAAFEGAATPWTLVINNAGINLPGDVLSASDEDWDRVLDINLRGAVRVARAAARRLKAAGQGGAIVNVASILGLRVAGGVAAYATSKAALVQFTRAAALEWARHDIRVNALCPGYIETDLNRGFFATEPGAALIRRIPQRRLGRPADLDGALLLLASDAGRYITGITLAVDGGHLVSSL